jgi:hypothetical protein
MLTLGVQNVRLARPTLFATRASSPTAVPMSLTSVRLRLVLVVMPAGKDVGHFVLPSLSTAQHAPGPPC